MEAILFSIATFVSTLLGGLFGIKNKDRLHLVISFTAGVLIGVAFFDILPEIFQMVQESGMDITYAMVALVAGFFVIHLLEKIAVIHSSHEEEYADHRHPTVGYIGAFGLAFHSFLDGLGIGLAFQVNTHIGFLVAFAVIAHDFSDGLNTVSIMLINKHNIRKSIMFLVIDALVPVLGVVAAYMVHIPQAWLIGYLGFFAGFLLYIGASDLLPEAHSKHSSYKMLGLTLLGSIFIFFVTRFAGF